MPGSRRDRADQPGRQTLPAVRLVGADRADLRPAGRVLAFAGHRDQHAVAADAEVGAELHGARPERARLGAGDQFEDLRHVLGPEPHRLGMRARLQGGVDQLDAAALELHLPLVPGPSGRAGQGEGAAGPDQGGGVGPGARVGRVGERDERGDVRVVAHGTAVAFGKVGVMSGERGPDRMVQDVAGRRDLRRRDLDRRDLDRGAGVRGLREHGCVRLLGTGADSLRGRGNRFSDRNWTTLDRSRCGCAWSAAFRSQDESDHAIDQCQQPTSPEPDPSTAVPPLTV